MFHWTTPTARHAWSSSSSRIPLIIRFRVKSRTRTAADFSRWWICFRLRSRQKFPESPKIENSTTNSTAKNTVSLIAYRILQINSPHCLCWLSFRIHANGTRLNKLTLSCSHQFRFTEISVAHRIKRSQKAPNKIIIPVVENRKTQIANYTGGKTFRAEFSFFLKCYGNSKLIWKMNDFFFNSSPLNHYINYTGEKTFRAEFSFF